MPTPERLQKLKRVAKNRQAGFIVILEDIHDPHNAAAVLRTCDAFSVQEVHFIFEKEKQFNPRSVGKVTSASANKWLTTVTSNSTSATIRSLKKKGYEIIATVTDESAENIFTARLTSKKIAILIGNEHRGLSPAAIALATRRITIPMRGMVQSINLSVTAAILMYEITRQRAKQKKQHGLTQAAATKLYKQFLKKIITSSHRPLLRL